MNRIRSLTEKMCILTLVVFACLVLFGLFSKCSNNKDGELTYIEIWPNVCFNYTTQENSTVPKMLIKEDGWENPEVHAQNIIKGFSFTPGFHYKLLVRKINKEKIPGNEEEYIYELVEITEKKEENN